MIQEILTPRINTNDDKVEVVEWHVKTGVFVEVGQEVVDLETSKAIVTVVAEKKGYFRALVSERSVVRVGVPLYLLADSVDELNSEDQEIIGQSNQVITSIDNDNNSKPHLSRVGRFTSSRFSKAAIHHIEAHGLSVKDFPDAGLVTVQLLTQSANSSVPIKRNSSYSFAGPVTSRSETVSLAKQAEIQNLTLGEDGNVNSTLTVYFDSEPIRARLIQEKAFEGNIQPLILFEISRLLSQWPKLNAYYAEQSVHYYDRIDLGLAFDLGKGLKVVTIADADKLMPIDFHEKTVEIGIRYLENRISPEELVGSTITVTDLSGFDVVHFRPLINGYQAAIVGLGGDSTQPGYPMSINITFDHRILNGREVATFLQDLRRRLISYGSAQEISKSYPTSQTEFIESAHDLKHFPRVDPENACCDRCLIDLVSYYRDFSRDAYMLPHFREDGTLGMICHRCYGGWT